MVELEVQNYEENRKLYLKLESQLRQNVGNDVPINHVGSTVLPDMIGKNIIDILVGAKDADQFEELFEKIEKMGYFPSKRKSEIYQFFASKVEETGSGDVHIHLGIIGTERYEEFLILRNYLLTNKKEAEDYLNCKKQIVNNITAERAEYRNIKGEYVTALLKRAKQSLKDNK